MVNIAAKKAGEEYLKKYLSKDNKTVTNKHKKTKKKSLGNGLKIHEGDAFATVAPCAAQSPSEESEEDVEIIGKTTIQEAPKFKRAAFESVDIKAETGAVLKRHDSSSDDSDFPDSASVPSTSVRMKKSGPVAANQNRSIVQNLRGRNNDESDISPPRRKIKDEPIDSNASPSRKSAEDAKLSQRIPNDDSDASPPRRRRQAARFDSDTSSPKHRRPADGSDSDASPRRQVGDVKDSNRGREYGNYRHRKRRPSDSEDSLKRKRIRDGRSDASSSCIKSRERTRKEHRETSRDTSSSKHHQHREDRRERRHSSDSERSSHRSKHDRSSQRDVNLLIGKTVGLKTLEAQREEMERLKEREAKMLESWEEYTSGKDAETVRRSKLTGKGRETKEDSERKKREAKKQQELEEKYKKWNKGLRQIEERKEKLNEMARVVQEDFTRYIDDKAMNEHMKEQLYEKDPMFSYVKKKKEEAEINSGTVYPKYKGSWPPNRFNIPPGYRWDGVNRSNGFEDKIAETANRKAAQRTEYYENIAKYEA